MKHRFVLAAFVASAIPFFFSCSLNRMAVRMVADSLTGGSAGTVFTGDDDPELVGDALPFALKLYESLLAQMPDHEGLALSTGSGFIMYANAFVAVPAGFLPDERWDERSAMYDRAKRLYLRGRDLLMADLERRHTGFTAALEANELETAFTGMDKTDVPFLYWAAAGWFGAYSLDVFDLSVGAGITRAAAMMTTAYRLDPDFGSGSIDDFYIAYYASMPEGMGGDRSKAREHFRLAVAKTDGMSAGPYVSLASTVCVAEQNIEEFTELLETALRIDPDARPEIRLMNILNQRKARWYLEHAEDYFLIDHDEPADDDFWYGEDDL
jgi:predicted anti-sigma-YlaC factor YlaD